MNDKYFGADSNTTKYIEKAQNESIALHAKLEDTSTDLNNLDTKVGAALNALVQSMGMFWLAFSLVQVIVVILGVPPWIVGPILTALMIVSILALISAFLGRRTD